ncbi:MAG TPA: sulfatase-like hydrolase/transferase [Planctomycetota bacterium]
MSRALPLLLLAGCVLPEFEEDQAPPPPNVLMIVGDDQSWTDFGFMGHPHIRTPHLDRLAAESLTYVNGYVPTSLCRASLATILTGQYAHRHRICCNDPPDGTAREAMHPFMQNAPTIPRLLRARDVRSFQTGKFWEGHYSNGGFTHGMTEKGRHGEDGLKIGRDTLRPIYDFIEADRSKPFFVWYAPMLPHEPHNPPDRLLKKYLAEDRDVRLSKYWAMCEWFDETVGELLSWLELRGLSDNTLVVFMIDNGWIQETGPRKTTRGNFAPKSKMSPYDGGLRTPVLIRWPGHVKPERREDLVSTVDVAPTILNACGVAPPPAMDGADLLRRGRSMVFGDLYTHTAVDLEKPALNLTHRWVRRGDWKLILPVAGPAELYDVRSDPFETKDRATADAGRVAELTKVLDAWWSGR